MSGTNDNLQDPSGTENQGNQSGTDSNEIAELKAQIAELRRESAKYRTTAKNSETEKQTIEEQLKALKEDFIKSQKENKKIKLQSMLDKAGCVKSELVIKDMPEDLENPEEWIEKYKEQNGFLFQSESKNHGGNHKPQGNKTLTPSQKMDAYIRAALGR